MRQRDRVAASGRGKALLYDVSPTSFFVVTFSPQPSVEFGKPETVAKEGLTRSTFTLPRPWDLSPDGTRILGTLDAAFPTQGNAAGSTMQVVENWFTELQQRVPTR